MNKGIVFVLAALISALFLGLSGCSSNDTYIREKEISAENEEITIVIYHYMSQKANVMLWKR